MTCYYRQEKEGTGDGEFYVRFERSHLMEVKQSAVFHFSHVVGGTTYTFSITAESRDEACKLLIKALEEIIDAVGNVMKAGTKSN
jgi:hypothetical protein